MLIFAQVYSGDQADIPPRYDLPNLRGRQEYIEYSFFCAPYERLKKLPGQIDDTVEIGSTNGEICADIRL